MILSALAAKLKQRSKADFKGRHYEATLIVMLWCFLTDLTDRQVRILWQGAAMDQSMQKLLPMCEYGFEKRESGIAAQKLAHALLNRLQAEGLYC